MEHRVTYGVCCRTINCTRVLARNDKTAHELINGLKPDVSKFLPFYVPGIAYVSADERRDNRVYAKTKKKKSLEELEILPICSKKRVCEKIGLEEIFEI